VEKNSTGQIWTEDCDLKKKTKQRSRQLKKIRSDGESAAWPGQLQPSGGGGWRAEHVEVGSGPRRPPPPPHRGGGRRGGSGRAARIALWSCRAGARRRRSGSSAAVNAGWSAAVAAAGCEGLGWGTGAVWCGIFRGRPPDLSESWITRSGGQRSVARFAAGRWRT